jgi:hypothetical protein
MTFCHFMIRDGVTRILNPDWVSTERHVRDRI